MNGDDSQLPTVPFHMRAINVPIELRYMSVDKQSTLIQESLFSRKFEVRFFNPKITLSILFCSTKTLAAEDERPQNIIPWETRLKRNRTNKPTETYSYHQIQFSVKL